MKQYQRYLLTGAIVLVAVVAVLLKYSDYVANPWTRDGHVRASVIKIAARVTGPIVSLPIKDNQFVRAGDVLFEIDRRTFEASLEQAKAQLAATGDNYEALIEQVEAAKAAVEMSRLTIKQAEATINEVDSTIAMREAELERQKSLLPKKATSLRSVQRAQASYDVSAENRTVVVAGLAQTKASLAQSQANLAKARASLGALGDDNPQIRMAVAALRQAELNLEFTRVTAPVDGYVTNLQLRLGSLAAANQPVLALIDTDSFWVHGYFKENQIANIRPGDRAVVTLMTYPDMPVEGHVDSLGWGIAQQDGSTGADLLPNISATFEWIRLAQRVPVRVHLDSIPDGIDLRVGTTASVLVMTGAAGEQGSQLAVPAPKALQ